MNKIKAARKAAGMSQKFVAMTLGVKGPSVSNWESGKTTPTPDNLAALAELFNVSVDYLLGRDDSVFITGNPGSGKSSALAGDWYPPTTPQPPLVLDGGMKGWPEDRPETKKVAAEVMAKALNRGLTPKEIFDFFDLFPQLLPEERKNIMSNMMFLRSQHNEEGET